MRNKRVIILFSIIAVIALTLILGGVIFSIDRVDVYFYNSDGDGETVERILSHANAKGQNIFFLDTDKIKNDIERDEKLVNFRVVNIERKFPNIVYINTVEVFDYVEIKFTQDGAERYAVLDNTGRITKINTERDLSLISMQLNGALVNPKIGERAVSDAPYDEINVITLMLDALSRFGYGDVHYKDAREMVESVSVSNSEQISVKTRAGVKFLFYQSERMTEKMRLAVSVYLKRDETGGTPYRTSGTIIVTNQLQFFYRPETRPGG